MKKRPFTARVLELSGSIMFIAAWYSIARLIVLCYAVNAYSFCKNLPHSPLGDNCQGSIGAAPTYLQLHGDTVHDWVGAILTAGVFLFGSAMLCYLIFHLTTNGRGGRPFYALIHIMEKQSERGWFGRHKRKHFFILFRDK